MRKRRPRMKYGETEMQSTYTHTRAHTYATYKRTRRIKQSQLMIDKCTYCILYTLKNVCYWHCVKYKNVQKRSKRTTGWYIVWLDVCVMIPCQGVPKPKQVNYLLPVISMKSKFKKMSNLLRAEQQK